MTAPATSLDSPAAEAKAPPFGEGIALLWGYVRPRLATICLGIFLGLLGTGVGLASPLATKWVLDTLGTPGALARPVTILIVLLAVGSIAYLAQAVVLGRLAENIVLDARTSLIQRFFRARLEDIQAFKTGELVTRVTSDTVLLREAAATSVVQIVNGTVSLIGTVVLMAVLDLPLLGTTLAALAIITVLFIILMPKIGKADKQAQDAIGEVGAALESGMRALRTVKSSRAEAREIARVRSKAEESAHFSIRSVWYSALVWTVAGGGIQLAIITILGLGAWRVSSGELAVSTLVAFLLYAFNIVDPVTTLAGAFASLQSGLAAAARIRETEHLNLEDVATGAAPAASPELAEADPVLELSGISARYRSSTTDVLAGIDLAIPARGHIALVGPSGAGKTTIFSLLLRFIEPSAGELRLGGRPYGDLSLDEVRSAISYVEQETPIIPGSVRDNVLYRAPEASDDEAWAALSAVNLAAKVAALPDGLDAQVTATTLSGGERQRLAVARALIRPARVLLLDEATAQLDGLTEAAIQRVIATAARGGAVVTIAHRLSTVIDADQIIVVDEGRIRATGTHLELLTRDELYREFVAALRIQTQEA